MITTLFRIFKSGWVNFRRNIWLSVATISTLVLSLSVLYGLLIMGYAADFLVSAIKDKADISVYFKTDVAEENILKISDELSAREDVKDISYVSRDQALASFKEKHKDNQILMESLDELGENPLQASLNIKAYEVSQYTALANLFETARYKSMVEKVDFRQNEIIINKIFDISKNIKLLGLILGAILAGIAGLVTFNTIRLAIYSQKEEISVMRLVGAGNWFIRGPFVVEGFLSGAIAAVLTIVLFFGLSLGFSDKISVVFSGLKIFNYFMVNLFINSLVILAAGIGLGIFSSFIATRRYLKV